MILEPYHTILFQPLAFWAANSSIENIPEIVRCSGIAPVTDYTTLTIFVGERFGKQFIENIKHNIHLTLSATSVPTYESYQYKGVFGSIRVCSEEEIAYQHMYFDALTDIMTPLGYLKEVFFKQFFYQPSFAITFQVLEVFDQTPRKGTGKLLLKKEAQEQKPVS